MKLLIITHPFGDLLGGGSKREFFVIKEFSKLQTDISIYIPFRDIVEIFFLFGSDEKKIKEVVKKLSYLERREAKIHPYFFDLLENYKLREFFLNLSNRYRKFTYLIEQLEFENLVFRKVFNEYKSENYDLIYSPHDLLQFFYLSFLFSNKLHKKVAFLLHGTLFTSKFLKISPLNGLLDLYYYKIAKKHIYRLLKNKNVLKFLGVSLAPFIFSGIHKLASKYKVYWKIIKPANAFDKKLLKYRKFKKENYIIFFARLVPEKGIYEIPLIMKNLKESYDKNVKIIVCGKFPNEKIKNNFLKLVTKHKVKDNVELKGFVEEKELYKLVSKAKVLAYPSHQDTFSLVILESLALGTSVVAYNIPAIVSVYRNLKPVKIVKEGDIKSITNEIVKILKMDDEEYLNEHEDERLGKFLSLHSSWKNVAKAELRELKTF